MRHEEKTAAVLAFAAQKLLSRAREWNPDRADITEEAFLQSLAVEGVATGAKGNIWWQISDGGAFSRGHKIKVLEQNGSFVRAKIMG